ncbi:hypothetical protein [Nocardia camponoti]|uniref:Uncharacterized protein n=1 Tax=Nocardia camponoti TaxID=1616106 RepID=A0A917QLM9_9NOCA|nr:hypothetical protein [Nocardia camponoti]GGK57070.1 hypothetical protein GCM10011591_31490 [Nocardia camponoti]
MSLPARYPEPDDYSEYSEYGEYTDQAPHRCGGACGRPGCDQVPQGYSPTTPIYDEGYGHRLSAAEPEPERGFHLPVLPRMPRSRGFIAVVAILLITFCAGSFGFALGNSITLF